MSAPVHPIRLTPSILVVEDERKTRESLIEGLGLEGWEVTAAASGSEAVARLKDGTFDLIILDWRLPDDDGLEILRQFRALGGRTPTLMLTARSEVRDRVAGLEGGADDFLAKPFAFAELLARCRALLRRPGLSQEQVCVYGDLRLDARARVAVRGGREISLTPQEVDLLQYLLKYQGQIVTREMLERDVWNQTHRFTSLDNVIEVQIMRLRRKIDGDGEKLIHTLRGLGYRLGAEPA